MTFAGRIPPSLWKTIFSVVLIARSSARSPIWFALSIMLQRLDVDEETTPRKVGRLDPGHQTLDPKVTSETMHISSALANGLGAAPRKAEL